MYSDKANVNILTALLLRHRVLTAVVCPGSRNAPIVHNLHEAGIRCLPVTDERSAGFYALGMAEALGEPVAVCVTSGSALLNLAPAVAEAYHRRLPLVVISADRPMERIGQLDAQTLPQQGALGCFVAMSVTLPEPDEENTADYVLCNRLANEALLEARRSPSLPVHINVPVTEPLFHFTQPSLPDVRMIRRFTTETVSDSLCERLSDRLAQASRPLIVVGQTPPSPIIDDFITAAQRTFAVLYEPLSCSLGGIPYDDALAAIQDGNALMPDFILYLGGIIVSKRLKLFLTASPTAETWAVADDGKAHDTFQNLTAVIDAPLFPLLQKLTPSISKIPASGNFHDLWRDAIASAPKTKEESVEERAVRLLEEEISKCPELLHVHYANSTAVRLGCRHARHYIHVNRGVNGIEGSLSTAAGFSLCARGKTVCVIGDLSFFYDSNALWNTALDGRLRILLLNNGGGAIFRTLPGLDGSPVRDTLVMAQHHTSAEGLCLAHNVRYLRAADPDYLPSAIRRLLTDESPAPILLEVMINPQ